MALFPKTPGVYVQEISTLPPSIAPVATAIPAFIGYTEKAIINGTAWTYPTTNFASGEPAPPVRIESMVDYVSLFGGPVAETYKVTLTTADVAIAVSRQTTTDHQKMNLYYHMQMYFGNGGGPCYIISIGGYGASSPFANANHFLDGITIAEKADEITLVLSPEAISLGDSDRKGVYNGLLAHCAKLRDRFAIMDVQVSGTINADATDFRSNNVGANNLNFGSAYYPSLNTILPLIYQDTDVTIDASDPTLPLPVQDFDTKTLDVILNGDSINSIAADVALYYRIKADLESRLTLYPSSTMAGVYATVDRDRGVWKAPANVGVNLVSSLTVTITNEDQENLNVDVTGKSINAIRDFAGRGTLVWGARTLDGNSNEWRYVNVRRLFIMAEESAKKATEFVVFEPNDKNTWLRVKGMISNFLTNLWRDGALAGDKPEQAFFVKVGLGETMTAQDILEGRMIVSIGLAAVRPAEFIILEFMHKLQEA